MQLIISIEDIKFKHNQEVGKVYTEKDRIEKENNELRKELNEIKNSRLYKLFYGRKNKNE